MLRLKKDHRLLLSIFLLIGMILLQSHTHDETTVDHEQCSICIVQEVFDISDAPCLVCTLLFVPFIYIAFATQTHVVPLRITRSTPSRAPPLFS